ncbi:cytochrome P450 2A4-like [Leptodactylus fuscus]|uniref:cytochrome P450 2A4-like n=1 Tax=Leptodactylus fuscus TaxID=238119 RepID=UPI003F4ED1CF
MLLVTTVLLLVFLCLLWTIWQKGKNKDQAHLPPGPPPLPVVGNILQINPRKFIRSLQQFQEKYGPVFTVYFGSRPSVMLSGYDVVKEALIDNKDVFGGRGRLPLHQYILKGYGIVSSNGERWKQMRRFALTTLRNFGMGKRSIEERIQEELQFLVEKFNKTEGEVFDPTFLISCAVSNVICSIVFGQRFSYDDEHFLSLLKNITGTLQFMSSVWGLIFYYLHGIVHRLPGPHQKGIKHLTDLRAFVQEKVDESAKTLNADSTRHFIDCFLVKMQQDQQNPSTEFHNENLVGSSMNLFFAGTETTSTTLRYGILILLKYPEIQAKIQDEIDRVIGDHCPSAEDRTKMPYTEAVIYEILRFSDIVPTGVPHCTTQDVSFRGYTIPKGTDVFPLLTTVLKDPEQFLDPEVFSPERFLDDKGAVKIPAAFMPFSAGRRMCPGEGLARMELFLFVTTLLQKFTLTSTVSRDDLDLRPEFSSSGHLPRSYKMSAVPRKMFDPTFLLGCAVSNIICSIVFAKRFSYNDERFLSLLCNVTGGLRFMNSSWALIFYYFNGILNHIPGPHQKGLKHFTDLKKFVLERVDESEKTLNTDSPQHFIDCFLIKMKEEEQNPDTEFHKENLVGSTMNLFFAGTETTNTTLRYAFLILLKHPEIQAKIQHEIDHVIGHHCPSADDRAKMPYTEAVIHEIQRFSDIIPTGLPHSTTEDIFFRGYFIPKGTDVFLVLTTVLKDSQQFPQPMVFSPDRFLDDKGEVRKHAALMPFSAGKRSCPGEGLARMELFLFLTTLLQKFTLTTTVPRDQLDLRPEFSSAGHLPRGYKMSVIPRR